MKGSPRSQLPVTLQRNPYNKLMKHITMFSNLDDQRIPNHIKSQKLALYWIWIFETQTKGHHVEGMQDPRKGYIKSQCKSLKTIDSLSGKFPTETFIAEKNSPVE